MLPETDTDRAWAPAPERTPNECCRDAANLTTIEKDTHVLVRRCLCGRRHFKAVMPLGLGQVQIGAPQAAELKHGH